MKKQKDYTWLLVVLVLTIAVLASSCTDNQMARQYGGKETIELNAGERLVNVTWKGKEGSDMWILTKQDTTRPAVYKFTERSNYGIMEGEVTIVEK